MSFFFSPIPSQYQSYCVLIPVLPYFSQILGGSQMNSKLQIHQTVAKAQQLYQNSFGSKESMGENQKQNNFLQQQSPLKIQEQIFLQSKKATAALQFHQIHNENTQSGKEQGQSRQSATLGKEGTKGCNKISKAIKIKKIKQVTEQEYQPFEKRRKFQTNIRENQNRNIIPNEVNQIFSYIQKSSKSRFVVGRIFRKYPPSNPEFNMKKFYLYQSLLKQKISNYINESSLSLVTELYEPRCQVYSQQQQRYYNKVCRMLIHHFLQEDSIFNILTSRRMHPEKKRNHLEMRRVLKSKVIEILRH